MRTTGTSHSYPTLSVANFAGLFAAGATTVAPGTSAPPPTARAAPEDAGTSVEPVSARSRPAAVSFHCRGHAGIAASHDKTIEFTRDREITRRATCVLGVGSDHDNVALLQLRGDVSVAVEAGGERDEFSATLTPFFVGDDSLIFRRGPGLRGRTLGYDASKTAAAVNRALVEWLTDPATDVVVTITETRRARPCPGALFVVALPIGNDGDLAPRARQVLEAADVVLAEDTRRYRDLAAPHGHACCGGVAELSRPERGGAR